MARGVRVAHILATPRREAASIKGRVAASENLSWIAKKYPRRSSKSERGPALGKT